MTDKAESVSGKVRKMIRDLGPLGMLALVAAVFIFKSLMVDDLSGGLLSNSSSSEQSVLEERQREKVTALFESIEEVTVDNIIISYETITDSSTTLFASNQNSQLVAKSVVILHQGSIAAEYDITRAISLLLDVPFHQISLLNTTDIIGGN